MPGDSQCLLMDGRRQVRNELPAGCPSGQNIETSQKLLENLVLNAALS